MRMERKFKIKNKLKIKDNIKLKNKKSCKIKKNIINILFLKKIKIAQWDSTISNFILLPHPSFSICGGGVHSRNSRVEVSLCLTGKNEQNDEEEKTGLERLLGSMT